MRAPDVQSLVEQLSSAHPLQATGGNYKRDFISAAQNVYPAQNIEKILQEKFFIPDDSAFRLGRYLQCAAELSVQNHLKQNPSVKKFDIDKKVNPENNKDVEAYFEVGGAVVSLEVKCPEETFPDPNSYVLKPAGRVPNFDKAQAVLEDIFRESKFGHVFETDRNRDNQMKDFLVSANSKFSPQSSCGDLNILFVACGDIESMNNWWLTLFGSHELFTPDYGNPEFFTAESRRPTPDDFKLVDVVILSNLKYLHNEAREHHEWTLKNTFLVPLLNPHGRRSLTGSSLKNGLSVFDHHYYHFNNFIPKRASPVAHFIKKLECYYLEAVDENKKVSYFPTQPPVKYRLKP